MTTITHHFARSLGLGLTSSDNIVVTSLDHDANVTPWKLVAEERGAQIRVIDFNPSTCRHDTQKLETYCDKNTKEGQRNNFRIFYYDKLRLQSCSDQTTGI